MILQDFFFLDCLTSFLYYQSWVLPQDLSFQAVLQAVGLNLQGKEELPC